ncbi:M18 family aminopeptidase [Streptomyces sp. MAR4 CNX-425]|uniref:M18 family aminopeptidase n=1 Tax=Streptomyces sp. MAR4 CNX-425 TaxID=3406343 RepID=UPI003B512C91
MMTAPPPRFDRGHTDDLAGYLTASPTPYHAVAEAARRLEKAGFTQLHETDAWDATAGGRYVLRGGALIAWYVPEGCAPETPFRIVGAHTDSPNLRVKPVPDTGAQGWRQIAVEVYGGTLLNTWLDRDLGLAGRLTLRPGAARAGAGADAAGTDAAGAGAGGTDAAAGAGAGRVGVGGETRLVNVDRPLLRVPQLAVHLDRGVNADGLKLDKQRHMTPIWGLGNAREGDLVEFLAGEAGVAPGDVLGWDLMVHSVEPPAYLGRDRELLAGPRMDNLLSVHAGVAALAAAATADTPPTAIPVLAAFDHEENGSQADTGAEGPLLGNVLRRTVAARGGSYDDTARALAGSVCLSSDTGHAVHPNYPERHEPGHRPMPNAGPILKVNVNQRYATDGTGRALFATACERAGVPWQSFVSNNAMPCGTTIGPITAARHGITTVDIGVAILSMHSARELCGADDPHLLAGALAAFLTE